jgi:hypothetical protein
VSANRYDLLGTRILELLPVGSVLQTSRDVTDLIGDALGQQVDLVLLPTARLDDSFFELRTGFAGECIQKFVNYGLRLAIVGDLSSRVAASASLRDLVREANRGTQVWFVADHDDLASRLSAVVQPSGRD